MLRDTGQYEKITREGKKPFSFYTFTPQPLVGNDFYVIDDELSSLLINAHRELGILEGAFRHLPDCEAIRNIMVARECYFSRQIDYSEDNTFSALLKAHSLGKIDASNIQNIISAFEFSLNETVHNSSLSKVCSIALYGHKSSQSIKEREKAIFLGRVVSNLKEYNPTAPERILPAIADITAFLQNNNKIDVLIRAALAHYQFEMIHPYECYNGIVGRIMIPMILHTHGGIKAASFIGVSEYLYFCKNDYFEILRSTQYSGGYIALIKFFVRAVYESAKTANTRIEHMLRIFADDEKRISASHASNKVLPMAFDYFKSRIYSQVRMVSNDLGISFNTAIKSINILCELNILQMENVQARHRVFVYNRLLEALSEGVTTE